MRQLLSMILLVLLWTPPTLAASFNLFGDGPKTVIAKDGVVTVDVADLAASEARHYRFRDGKTNIKFFLARDEQNTVRGAIDACEVCWQAGKGYKLETSPRGGVMICLNCGRKFPLSRVGISAGGCNPHPLQFTLENNSALISVQELLLGAKYFPENGQ